MTKTETKTRGGKTSNRPLYFSSWYDDDPNPARVEDFSKTARLHIEKIDEREANSVLDIGCGAGGILLALQDLGVQEIYGVDASKEALALARKRFKKFGSLDGVDLAHGNAVDMDLPAASVVSLHRVLCCYPDVSGLLQKATENYPQFLIFTIPPRHLLSRFINFIENIFLKIGALFKPSMKGLGSYVHSMKVIDRELQSRGYKQTYKQKMLIWHTYAYEKQ